MPKRVAIWRLAWLANSETFIANQIDNLSPAWVAQPVTTQVVPSTLQTASPDCLFANSLPDRMRRSALVRTARSRRLVQVLGAAQFDLVHAHFGPDATLVAPSAARAALPLVVTFHGFDATSLPLSDGAYADRYRRRLPALFRYSSALLAVSQFIAERLIQLGAPTEKIRVHHIGVPIPAETSHHIDTGPILFVGRLVEKKGLADLLEAVSLLPPELRDRRIEIVGDGELRASLEQRARDLRLNAHFLGSRAPAEVRARLLDAAVFVAPSKTAASGDSEGLPTTVQEAAAVAVPIVSTHHAGIPEIIEHEVTGLLAPEGDASAIAENLNQILQRPAQAWAMAATARSRATESFNIQTQTQRLEEIYEESTFSPRVSP